MVSRRSESNVMVKNMIDVTLGGIAYWFVGFGFSFGENSKPSKTMSGASSFVTDVDIFGKNAYVYAQYFFQLSFATTATTIVSGKLLVPARCKREGHKRTHVYTYLFIYILLFQVQNIPERIIDFSTTMLR